MGKLVTVSTGRPGVGVKMTVEEATARGLVEKPGAKVEKPAAKKARKPAQNKMREASENKAG